MSLERIARKIHADCIAEKRKNGLKQKKFNINERKRIFGILIFEQISSIRQRVIGFVICLSENGEIRYTLNFLPSKRENIEKFNELCVSLKKSGGVCSSDPIQFLIAIAKIFDSKDFCFSNLFLNFNYDLKWTYDEACRRCLARQVLPKTFIFLEKR